MHNDIGQATGAAYKKVMHEDRAADMGDLVLELSSELQSCDFDEAFVNAFDVANKVTEVLMQRQGIDVCCSDSDDLIARFEASQEQ